jgi:carbon-monoxide dehydrogenase large subunit
VFASAIEDAEGFVIRSMPISPSELFELRRRHAAGKVPSLQGRHDVAPDAGLDSGPQARRA